MSQNNFDQVCSNGNTLVDAFKVSEMILCPECNEPEENCSCEEKFHTFDQYDVTDEKILQKKEEK